jgi:hypothetical protein
VRRARIWFGAGALSMGALVLTGCVSGSKLLGEVTLKDGRTLQHVQVITQGQDGPKLAVIETYIYDPVKNASSREAQYQAAGSSLTAEILRGAASSALFAGGIVGAAAVLRPDQTNVTQTGGGAQISNSGNSSASASGGSGGSGGAGGVGGAGGAGGSSCATGVAIISLNCGSQIGF